MLDLFQRLAKAGTVIYASLVMQLPATELYVDPQALQTLRELASHKNEEERCLLGEYREGKWWIYGVFKAPYLQQAHNAVGMEFQGCPDNSIGFWHTHPGGACVLSGKDVLVVKHNRPFPLVIVQTDTGLICWWTRKEVLEGSKTLRPLWYDHEKKQWFLPDKRTPAPAAGMTESLPPAASHIKIIVGNLLL